MNAVHASEETLEAYVMGTLVGDEADLLERHVGQCDACALSLAAEARLEEKLFAIAAATKGVVAIDPTRAAPSLEALASSAGAAVTPTPEASAPARDVWQIPAAQKPTASRWPWVVLAGSIACLCVAAGLFAGAFFRASKTVPNEASAPLAMNPVIPSPPPSGEYSQPPPFAQPIPGQPLPSPPVTPVPGVLPSAPPAGQRHTRSKAIAETPSPTPATKGGSLDGLFNEKPAPTGKATLDRSDVLGVMRANIPALKACTSDYARSLPMPPKLVVKFVIVPSGNTSSSEVMTPEFKGTSVESCVLKVLHAMKFPEYQSGNIPVVFPIPIGP